MSEASAIDLSGEITERLNTQRPGKIAVMSYVDSKGQPHVSVRASVIVYGRDQLALWVRDSYVGTMTVGAQIGAASSTPSSTPLQSGLLAGIEQNPLVAVLFREGTTTYVFSGRAHVEADDAAREAIFSQLPDGERNHSTVTGARTGTAVVIDLDSVIGGSLGEGGVIASHVEMSRS
ncbi:MAG TPA: pyridoxamine 5'-phosphate oxidase family protein [Acidimicrobiales bacterium]